MRWSGFSDRLLIAVTRPTRWNHPKNLKITVVRGGLFSSYKNLQRSRTRLFYTRSNSPSETVFSDKLRFSSCLHVYVMDIHYLTPLEFEILRRTWPFLLERRRTQRELAQNDAAIASSLATYFHFLVNTNHTISVCGSSKCRAVILWGSDLRQWLAVGEQKNYENNVRTPAFIFSKMWHKCRRENKKKNITISRPSKQAAWQVRQGRFKSTPVNPQGYFDGSDALDIS